MPLKRTRKLQRSRAVLHKMIAQLLTRQLLFIRPWFDQIIDQRIPRRSEISRRLVLLAEECIGFPRRDRAAIGEEGGISATGEEVGCVGGEDVTAGNGDGTDPGAVGVVAVLAGAGKGVLS